MIFMFINFVVVDKHQVPIGQMGNYQQHLKKLDPLRELDTGAVRTQLFGNPFKLEKPSDKARYKIILRRNIHQTFFLVKLYLQLVIIL